MSESKPMLPAALKVYHKSLANVDFLHGSAESMLTVTNLLIGKFLYLQLTIPGYTILQLLLYQLVSCVAK